MHPLPPLMKAALFDEMQKDHAMMETTLGSPSSQVRRRPTNYIRGFYFLRLNRDSYLFVGSVDGYNWHIWLDLYSFVTTPALNFYLLNTDTIGGGYNWWGVF